MTLWERLLPDLPADETAWRRFVRTVLIVFGGGLLAIYAALVVIDPYDTGRFPTFMPAGITYEHQYINNASRGRNPNFNAAIFGNSHGQLISPIRLADATGLKFIQMTSPGSGPREQLAYMHWFVRHHPDVSAVVLTADEKWCTHNPALPALYQFSPWLVGDSNMAYLAHILSTRSIAAARRRVAMALGREEPYDPIGYWDYETGKAWNYHPLLDQQPPRGVATAPPANRFFPAIDALDATLAGLPKTLPFVIVMAPQYYLMLPESGSTLANEMAACKSALAERVAGRTRSGFLDFLRDTATARNPENFMDAEHYRHDVARFLEGQIAQVLGNSAR